MWKLRQRRLGPGLGWRDTQAAEQMTCRGVSARALVTGTGLASASWSAKQGGRDCAITGHAGRGLFAECGAHASITGSGRVSNPDLTQGLKVRPSLRSPTSLPAGPQASAVELCVAAGPHPGPRGRGRRQSSVCSLCQAGSGTAPSHQTCSAGSWVTSGHLSRLSELSACTCEVGEVRAAPRGAVCPARDLGAGRGRHCKTQLCPLRAHRPGRNRQ